MKLFNALLRVYCLLTVVALCVSVVLAQVASQSGTDSYFVHSQGRLILGTGPASDILLLAGQAATPLGWEIDGASGDLVTSGITTDIGWTLQSAANQACNTTCTSGCVFGGDTATDLDLVACTDATADICLCAGAS